MSSAWWSAHTHSQFSTLDGMSKVPDIVARAAKFGQPAIGITDHGNMAGTVQLYQSAKKAGIACYPGVEAYMLDPTAEPDEKKPGRFHLGLLALDLKGYQALVKMVTLSHTRPRFSRFARIYLDDLADLGTECGDHIALMTGCYFGYPQQMMVRKEDPAQALKIIKMYRTWFPHTFVEVQHHSICHDQDEEPNPYDDDTIVRELIAVADKLSLPVIATQDSHYLLQSDKPSHALMKRMVYGGADDEFPGDSFHVASDEWVQEHYTDKQWDRILEGHGELLDLNNVTIPPLDKFKAHIPELVKNPMDELKRRCAAALTEYAPANKEAYIERLRYELNVVDILKIAGYFIMVSKCVEWCKSKSIAIEARGSANSSLFCFLLGITQIDPLEWELDTVSFDRFLSRDRIKPPDVDMDIEDTQRDRIIAYLERNFDTSRIGTFAQLGKRDDGQGSVFVTYQTYVAREAEAKAKERGRDAFAIKEAGKRARAMAGNEDLVRVNFPHDYPALMRMAEMKSVYKSYGVHAAGILVSGTDMAIDEYVPKMFVASSESHVTQFDMDDVEKLGYLKMDWLGQNTLSVMKMCQQMIGRKDPTDFTWIPLDDPDTCKAAREGRTDTGVFHLEGYTKAKGGKELGIRSTKDFVLVQALYMPGAMESGQTAAYIDRRRHPAARKAVKYPHAAFEKVLSKTYGAVVFQEQVLAIMRGLGMSLEGVNKWFAVVKDSGAGSAARNSERLAEVRTEFDKLCLKNGIEAKNIQWAWDMTAGFAAYGFNRAHASGYGLRSYRCQYLKVHYPLEFMTALLKSWSGNSDKERAYVREARRVRIRVLPPDVNVSGAVWTLDRNAKSIRRGLQSIKGVGLGAADAIATKAPFESVEDLIERTDSRAVTGGKTYSKDGQLNGVLFALREAGALESLGVEPEDM